MKCVNCEKELTTKQEEYNNYIAKKTGNEKVDMCDNCWANYCYHTVTGE